ncbi:hypothetical protein CPAR01_08464 [Colletotrichum paranaense]|uniref:Uncharacterized protein n=1 Tax=Colletotrichum paranaense TaxID=1914294 RepID=A0ABQ9SKE2_9PEZI|nr:uncharacterized protein CPAR01_08464 [Colletotrichum paranaense]KAK1538351.1 hypothetical protein CPAR01_08464 [Colletotrichum paranaense]
MNLTECRTVSESATQICEAPLLPSFLPFLLPPQIPSLSVSVYYSPSPAGRLAGYLALLAERSRRSSPHTGTTYGYREGMGRRRMRVKDDTDGPNVISLSLSIPPSPGLRRRRHGTKDEGGRMFAASTNLHCCTKSLWCRHCCSSSSSSSPLCHALLPFSSVLQCEIRDMGE